MTEDWPGSAGYIVIDQKPQAGLDGLEICVTVFLYMCDDSTPVWIITYHSHTFPGMQFQHLLLIWNIFLRAMSFSLHNFLTFVLSPKTISVVHNLPCPSSSDCCTMACFCTLYLSCGYGFFGGWPLKGCLILYNNLANGDTSNYIFLQAVPNCKYLAVVVRILFKFSFVWRQHVHFQQLWHKCFLFTAVSISVLP